MAVCGGMAVVPIVTAAAQIDSAPQFEAGAPKAILQLKWRLIFCGSRGYGIPRGVEGLRYTVVLVPDRQWISACVPAMPGCVSQGSTRAEALANVSKSIQGWIIAEAEQGRGPLTETPALISAGVLEALEIIEEMRLSGEARPDRGYELELVPVEAHQLAIA